MLEVLEFIFRDFWTWAGTAFLLGEILYFLAAVFTAAFNRNLENSKEDHIERGDKNVKQ